MFKMLKYLAIASVVPIPIVSLARTDEFQDRQLRALPTLLDQRNGALDSFALCSGDLAEAQRQLADVRKQIEELRKAAAPKDDGKPER